MEALAVAPGEGLVASGCRGGVVSLWDTDRAARLGATEGLGGIADLAFSPDLARLAAASNDGSVRLLRVPSLEEEAVLRLHGAPTRRVAFLDEGSALVSHAARTGDTVVVEVPSGRERGRYEGRLRGIHPRRGLLALTHKVELVRMIDPATLEIRTLLHEEAADIAARIPEPRWAEGGRDIPSLDGRFLAHIPEHGRIELLRTEGRVPISCGSLPYAHDASFDRAGARAFIASNDGGMVEVELETGAVRSHRPTKVSSGATWIHLVAGECRVALHSPWGGELFILDVETGEELLRVPAIAPALDEASGAVLLRVESHKLRVVHAASGEELAVLEDVTADGDAAFDPAGERLVGRGAAGRELVLQDLAGLRGTVRAPRVRPLRSAWALPQGRVLAVDDLRLAQVLDRELSPMADAFPVPHPKYESVKVPPVRCPSGTRLACLAQLGDVRVLSLPDGGERVAYQQRGAGDPMVFLPGRDEFLMGGDGGSVCLLDLVAPVGPRADDPDEPLLHTTRSSDGKWVAAVWFTRTHVLDARTGRLLRALPRCSTEPAIWSPDGERLATTYRSGDAGLRAGGPELDGLHLWDARSGVLLVTRTGKPGKRFDSPFVVREAESAARPVMVPPLADCARCSKLEAIERADGMQGEHLPPEAQGLVDAWCRYQRCPTCGTFYEYKRDCGFMVDDHDLYRRTPVDALREGRGLVGPPGPVRRALALLEEHLPTMAEAWREQLAHPCESSRAHAARCLDAWNARGGTMV